MTPTREFGNVVFTRFLDDRIRIDRANPHILVADSLLYDLHPVLRETSPPSVIDAFALTRVEHVAAEYPYHPQCGDLLIGMVCYYGWLLRIDGINQTAVYRIGPYRHADKAWEAHWVD